MKLAILDAQTFGEDQDLSVLTRGFDATIFDNTLPDQLADHIRGASVVVTNKTVLNRQTLSEAPVLRLIAVAATGTNNVDIDVAIRQGIAVANVPGYSTSSVAAHTFAMYFSLAHHMSYHTHYSISGGWSNSEIFTHLDRPWREPVGQVWGVIGLGNIGKAVALRAESFGFEVVYHSTTGKNPNKSWQQLPLRELLAKADVVSVHAPLNEGNLDLIGAHELALMKSNALLINTSRGQLVNELDLALALDGGAIAGAALDVLATEPPERDNPLFSLRQPERLILTPHIAGLSVQSRGHLLEEVRANIDAFLAGEPRNLCRDAS